MESAALNEERGAEKKHTTLNQAYSARQRPLLAQTASGPHPSTTQNVKMTRDGNEKKGRIRNKNRKGRSEKSENLEKKQNDITIECLFLANIAHARFLGFQRASDAPH